MFTLLKKIVPKKVKTKLLVTLCFLITLLIVIPSVLSYRTALRHAQSTLEHQLSATISQVLNTLTTEKAAQLRLLAHAVAGMPSVQDNLMFQSRDDLLTFTGPLYEGLRKIIDLNVFHFHLPLKLSLRILSNIVENEKWNKHKLS